MRIPIDFIDFRGEDTETESIKRRVQAKVFRRCRFTQKVNGSSLVFTAEAVIRVIGALLQIRTLTLTRAFIIIR